MSSALVKRGLELFEDDLKQFQDVTSHKKKKKKDPMKLISTNKKGVKKELQKVKRLQETDKAVKRKIQLTQGEKSKLRTDDIDYSSVNLQNINQMAFLSATTSCPVAKILDHERGRLAMHQPTQQSKEEEQSIFSDRDFDQFEKEYFSKS